ncbi:DNA gyrase C-terminal beta-propeller domain-containing protein, partial [Enterobacter cloacae]
HVLMAQDEQKYLMASDAGYGFICTFNDLVTKNKTGKALINLPDNAKILTPIEINNEQEDVLLAITK